MKKYLALLLCLAMLLTMSLSLTGCKKEAAYPSKPIEMVIPWTAGGGTDVCGRLYATYLEKYLGVTINISNVTGGTGSVGAAQVAGAKADGYTLLLSTFDFVTADVQGLANISIDNFDAIGSFSIQPTIYVVLSERWNSTEDFIAYAKANPGEVTVSHNGDGGVWHQAAALADNAMGIETNYIPYNGSSEQLAALLGGHTDVACISYNTVAEYLLLGDLYCIGTMTEERIEKIPDAKTFKEQGYDVVFNSFRGLVAPKGLPADVLQALRDACDKASADPDWLAAADKGAIDVWHVSGDEYAAFLKTTRQQIIDILTQIGML